MKLRTILNIPIAAVLSSEKFLQRRAVCAFKVPLPYNFRMKRKLGIFSLAVMASIMSAIWGCATQLPALVEAAQVTDNLVVGRIITVLTTGTTRRYLPEMRFLELEDRTSQKRFQLRIESYDRYFALNLPTGNYRLNRVQIREGPFMSMADVDMAFSVEAGVITHVGTWRFGVGIPRNWRTVMLSVVADQEETERARKFLDNRYPTFGGRSMVEVLPQPSQMEARLYETEPYPRYRRMFCRQLC